MKKYISLSVLLFNIFIMYSQLDKNTVMGIPTGTTTEINAVTPYEEGALAYDTVTKRLMFYNGTSWIDSAGANWLTNGNTGNSSTNFLGNIDNVKMQIRSNNWPMLEFGKRGTLGLTQNYPDYKDSNQPLVHIGGNGSTSALQFAASGADFYKPIFYTTSNGSFRLKGASGGTDIFEIGSAGTTNNGRLEFIIGDDGIEPIIFKRYDYNDSTYKEFFRVQGSMNTTNAKTRFGINLNPTGVPIDGTYNTADSGNIANSTFQVNGSVSKSIFTTTANLELNEDYHTIILGGNHEIKLPTASSCTGRIYVIKNKNNFATTISDYINEKGVDNIKTINNNSVLWLQSDGKDWQQITSGSGASSTGRSLYSVETTGATESYDYNPSNTNSFNKMDEVLPKTNIAVEVGDIVDVRVHISEDFATTTNQNDSYNDIGDVLRLYVTDATLIGSPTMIQTLITGGDNYYEVASGSLNQMFTVTKAGTLKIGIEIKFAVSSSSGWWGENSSRYFSTSKSGVGGLQAIIYR